tara:strand:+ start:2490 stop:3482 length:993 start_codon:yes stop_codon:yes gene_type:complete
MTTCKKKLFDPKKTLNPQNNPSVEDSLKEGPVNIIPPSSGIGHTSGPQPFVSYKAAQNERVIEKGGSYIVLGTDRPAGLLSGKGGPGFMGTNSIDMVVGRMAGAKKGEGVAPGTSVDNNFETDAARIYISQLTDIDKNFGMANADPLGGGRSGIGIKADRIAMIGREGVKIVTGPMVTKPGEVNSQGGSLPKAPPIQLIAGNNTNPRTVKVVIPSGIQSTAGATESIPTLQPVLLGENTKDAFKDLVEIIGEIWASLFAFAGAQLGYNAVVGVDPIRAWVPAGASTVGTAEMTNVMNTLWHSRTNLLCWQQNYLQYSGYKGIRSENVSTT